MKDKEWDIIDIKELGMIQLCLKTSRFQHFEIKYNEGSDERIG